MIDRARDPGVEDYLDRSTAAYRAQLRSLLEQAGVPEDAPEDIGRRAAASIAVGRRWDQDVGPFHDTDGARAALGGVTKQAVSDRVHRGALLGLPLAADGSGRTRLVYPVWQFDVLDHLHEVLPAAGYDVARPASAWTVALWLTTPDPRLDDLAPLALLRAGRRTGVMAVAAEVAASLGTDERGIGHALGRAG